jgi:hypothetical protein
VVKCPFDHKNGVEKMGYLVETTRSGFFQELPSEKQNKYLSLKRDKTISTIDNIYYTVSITGDDKDDPPAGISLLLEALEDTKAEIIKVREPIEWDYGLYYLLKSYASYGYCVGSPDFYDIFVCKGLPNNDTPRIVVQIRAYGLWTRRIFPILEESYEKVQTFLADYSLTVSRCRESRIDYCFHTNSISSVNKLIKEDSRGKVKNLHTNLIKAKWNADLIHEDDGTVHVKDYVCYGSADSNNVRARIYNKVKEVIEMGYKAFFFEIWHKNGLISFYDKFCMEYAFLHKNTDYLAKASLEFYTKYGTNPARRKLYAAVLKDPKTTMSQFKALAAEHMPKITTILNIEYETKRKFYYYSDEFINHGFKLSEDRKNISKPMERVYKILDYRDIFLDYLTSKTLSFYKIENGEPKFLAWWERLRNTKHDGKKTDEKLIRKYSCEMDKKAVQRRAVNSIASNAVYEDRLNTGFIEDLSDMLADITDNQAHRMLLLGNGGELLESISAEAVRDYELTKQRKEKYLKNRKKVQAEQRENETVQKNLGDELKRIYAKASDTPSVLYECSTADLPDDWK